MVENVIWKYSKGKVDESTLSEIERYFNVSFPSFYKEIVREYNGARPRPNAFHTIDGKEVRIRSFLPIGKDYTDNIVNVNKRLKDKLPQQLIAFANDDFGNYFCFDFKDEKEITIVFWEHENSELFQLERDGFLALLGSVR
ncbi:SMI1/KNR4 family protein [Desertibacillus haloalkaliphilus]|uniref:SMI1/KNR4 family protein n=1 Tax=Desertibacillus haloalkaliphilus TaxID=1328930 RepID=UPI001C257815|nr:SMI1/KNR4 family protein [Desertibacillus haloalkaliphilus]MBU8907668.1 SMI1/KNR4 family protein [Desertibacillus haloalkaliphilus]